MKKRQGIVRQRKGAFVDDEKNKITTRNSLFARLRTDYDIRNQWFFAILEAMTTDLDLSQWKYDDRLQLTVIEKKRKLC